MAAACVAVEPIRRKRNRGEPRVVDLLFGQSVPCDPCAEEEDMFCSSLAADNVQVRPRSVHDSVWAELADSDPLGSAVLDRSVATADNTEGGALRHACFGWITFERGEADEKRQAH